MRSISVSIVVIILDLCALKIPNSNTLKHWILFLFLVISISNDSNTWLVLFIQRFGHFFISLSCWSFCLFHFSWSIRWLFWNSAKVFLINSKLYSCIKNRRLSWLGCLNFKATWSIRTWFTKPYSFLSRLVRNLSFIFLLTNEFPNHKFKLI